MPAPCVCLGSSCGAALVPIAHLALVSCYVLWFFCANTADLTLLEFEIETSVSAVYVSIYLGVALFCSFLEACIIRLVRSVDFLPSLLFISHSCPWTSRIFIACLSHLCLIIMETLYVQINGCSLVDCLKHFTVLEQLDNYRCDHCWHNAAAKYFSLKVDEEKVNKLRTCVDYDSCNCKQLFGPEKTTWSVSSKATKQLAITRCPKILCIHLLRASVSLDGELVKRGGHVSFPLLLDLSPFAGGTFSTGQGPGPSAMNKQIYDLPSLHLYRQLNAQMPINMFPTGGNSSSQPLKDEVSNGGGCPLYKENVDVATSSLSLCSTSFSSRKELYGLSAVVEHYGICGGGHYAAYRRVASNPDPNDLARPRGKHWVYISDDHVSQVSEIDVLAAEATLLFYERL